MGNQGTPVVQDTPGIVNHILRDTRSCNVKSQESLKNQLFCTSFPVLSMTAFGYRGWQLELLQGAHHSPAPVPMLHIHLLQVSGNGSSQLPPCSESWQFCSSECMNQVCDGRGNHKYREVRKVLEPVRPEVPYSHSLLVFSAASLVCFLASCKSFCSFHHLLLLSVLPCLLSLRWPEITVLVAKHSPCPSMASPLTGIPNIADYVVWKLC